jgi:hypothetical protein
MSFIEIVNKIHVVCFLMAEDIYSFIKIPEEYYYEFYSKGPKGLVKKIVSYRLIQEMPFKLYNLGFGDWNNETQNVDDKINTNNQDRQKVLGTVAETVLDFLENRSKSAVFAKGSTVSRTRLYQMNIAAYHEEIVKESLHIYGYENEEWKEFKKGINFEAFILRK